MNTESLRIFISSPGDVAEERDRARQVIEGLRRRYAGVFFLKPVLWEELPLQADLSFQQGIEMVLSGEQGIDIAVFILWSRLGSPQNSAIRKADGTEYRSGTEREFDLMLEARRQSGGQRPAFLVYTRQDEASFEERLRGTRTEEKEDLIAQKKLVESFVQEEFQDGGSRHNLRAFHQFDRPQTFSQRLRTHLTELLDELAGEAVAHTVWDSETLGPPFMGLEAFGEKQALIFCGRDSEILESRRALATQAREGCAFLLLTGASGSGKSSLARAGLLPAIAEHELDETVAEWRPLAVTPSELGDDLIAGLMHRLATPDLLPELCTEGGTLADLLSREPASGVNLLIKRAVAEASQKRQGGVRLLLLLDQLEELLVMEQREVFLAVVEALARSGVCWVVATVRGDFLGEVQKSPALVRLISGRGLIPVLAPDADALRRMIEEPARFAGLHFEERDGRRLSDCILADAARHADLLPLVEFVLRELFDQRSESGALTWQAYETLGGVEGALARRADAVLGALPQAVQATLPVVLKGCVTLSEAQSGAEDGSERLTRQRVALDHFAKGTPIRALVDAFIRDRLLTANGEQGLTTATVTLAHEALLRVWPVAATWAEQNRDVLRTRARVALRMKESSPLLKGDPLLDVAKAFLITHPGDFNDEQRRWIEAAVAAAAADESRASRHRRVVLALLTGLTLIASAGAAWALKRERDAKAAERVAEERRRAAERAGQIAQNARTTAEGLINAMLYDLRDKLQPYGHLELLDEVFRQAEKYFEDNPSQTRAEQRREVAMWSNRGDVQMASYDYAAARKAYEQSLEIAERLAKAEPSNAEAQRDWSVSLNKVGDVAVAQRDLTAARKAYQASLNIRTHLAEMATGNAQSKADGQRDLSVSLNKLGDVAKAERDFSSARQAYQQFQTIAHRLAQDDPDNAEAQRDLMVAYVKMADLLEKQKDAGAVEWRDKALVQIRSMKQRGLLAPKDEETLHLLEAKAAASGGSDASN